jgi:hypothetical protein
MIVDYLTFTFVKEHEDKLADLVKKIDPGAVAVETKSGYAEYWSLWGSGWNVSSILRPIYYPQVYARGFRQADSFNK